MKATEVTTGLAESNDSLLPGLWRDSLHVTCGLTACTPGSAPGPTLSNKYGKTLPFLPEWAGTRRNIHPVICSRLIRLHYMNSQPVTNDKYLSMTMRRQSSVIQLFSQLFVCQQIVHELRQWFPLRCITNTQTTVQVTSEIWSETSCIITYSGYLQPGDCDKWKE